MIMYMKKYKDFNNINEFNNHLMTEDELLEMTNAWGTSTGLDDVVIWVGSAVLSNHGNRIKVSNMPSKNVGRSIGCFTITVPDLEVIGNINTKHITSKKLDKIFDFIKLNQDVIIAICQDEIDGVEFGRRIKKLN